VRCADHHADAASRGAAHASAAHIEFLDHADRQVHVLRRGCPGDGPDLGYTESSRWAGPVLRARRYAFGMYLMRQIGHDGGGLSLFFLPSFFLSLLLSSFFFFLSSFFLFFSISSLYSLFLLSSLLFLSLFSSSSSSSFSSFPLIFLLSILFSFLSLPTLFIFILYFFSFLISSLSLRSFFFFSLATSLLVYLLSTVGPRVASRTKRENESLRPQSQNVFNFRSCWSTDSTLPLSPGVALSKCTTAQGGKASSSMIALELRHWREIPRIPSRSRTRDQDQGGAQGLARGSDGS